MENRQPSQQQVAVWMAMAEHFLDTETEESIPLTAEACIQAGLSVEQARAIWQHEVSPALYLNLWNVAGEWAGWDEPWLVRRILAYRRRLRGPVGYLVYRAQVQGLHRVWLAIERCMEARS